MPGSIHSFHPKPTPDKKKAKKLLRRQAAQVAEAATQSKSPSSPVYPSLRLVSLSVGKRKLVTAPDPLKPPFGWVMFAAMSDDTNSPFRRSGISGVYGVINTWRQERRASGKPFVSSCISVKPIVGVVNTLMIFGTTKFAPKESAEMLQSLAMALGKHLLQTVESHYCDTMDLHVLRNRPS